MIDELVAWLEEQEQIMLKYHGMFKGSEYWIAKAGTFDEVLKHIEFLRQKAE